MDIINLRKKEKKVKHEMAALSVVYGITIIAAGAFISFTASSILILFLIGSLFLKNEELKKIRQNIEFEKSMKRYKEDVKLY